VVAGLTVPFQAHHRCLQRRHVGHRDLRRPV
jgi:hypothetical protein